VVLLGDTLSEPLEPWLPDHPPLPAHTEAFLLDHVSVDLPPAAMVFALALKVTVGGTGVAGMIVTSTDALPAPPVPAHVRV